MLDISSDREKKRTLHLKKRKAFRGVKQRHQREGGFQPVLLQAYKSEPRRRTSVGVRVSLVNTTVTSLVSPYLSSHIESVDEKLLKVNKVLYILRSLLINRAFKVELASRSTFKIIYIFVCGLPLRYCFSSIKINSYSVRIKCLYAIQAAIPIRSREYIRCIYQ